VADRLDKQDNIDNFSLVAVFRLFLYNFFIIMSFNFVHGLYVLINVIISVSLFVWLVADGWCWFVLREKYWWLVAGGWFVLREKYCRLVADKPSEQGM
jgi:hypothetical protein